MKIKKPNSKDSITSIMAINSLKTDRGDVEKSIRNAKISSHNIEENESKHEWPLIYFINNSWVWRFSFIDFLNLQSLINFWKFLRICFFFMFLQFYNFINIYCMANWRSTNYIANNKLTNKMVLRTISCEQTAANKPPATSK